MHKQVKMRVGMILDAAFPPDPRVENEAIELVNSGFEVYLFCLSYKNEPLEELINGIHVKRYRSSMLEYKLSALVYTIPLYTMMMKSKVSHFVKKHQIKALHIHDIRIADAVFKANIRWQLPIILDLHDNMPEVIKLYPHLQKFPGKQLISPKKWQQKEEQFIKKATKVITVSQEFVDEIIQRTATSPEKIKLVPNTIRASFYEEAVVENSILEKYKNHFVILYLGDTSLRRGLQTAIAGVKKLTKVIPNIKLVIVGKNTTDAVLRQQVSDLKIDAYVDFEGWQHVALFPSYIKASSICISPLHRNLQHDVAYANKLFQYMSLGKPLLVSDAIAQKKLIESNNCGLVHLEKDVADFSKKILALFHDEDLRTELGENGQNFVRKSFLWKHTSKPLIDIYQQLTLLN